MRRFWNTKEGRRILYAVAFILVLISVRIFFLKQEEQAKPVEQATKTVTVARVYDIASGKLPLPTIGRVEAQSEAILRTEASGEISRVTKKIGDRVRSGEIIAEINNASQRAEVLRAQGVLQGAQANMLKLENGSSESRTLIKEAVRNAFTTADDAVRNKADQLIKNPESGRPDIVTGSSDYFIRVRAEEKRADLNQTFKEWTMSLQSINSITNTEALVVYILTAQSNLEQTRAFLDDMALIVAGFEPNNNLSQGTIDKWRGDISVARSSVNSSLSNLINSYNNLRSQIDASNGGGEDVLLAQAQITQAEAGVLSAQASLEKTIIRSPISGEINQIDIQRGDFVSMQQEVVVVANNNALEIITSINEEDRKTIAVGASALVNDMYKGVVTRISPAINKQTGKIEVAIGVDEDTSLTNGQSVALTIDRTIGRDDIVGGVITVPITALKITAEGNFVFSVENGLLVASPVSVGSIIGEKIIITDGLSPTMEIVLDARGLKEGQTVMVR